MKRIRFFVSVKDYHPVNWPIKYPYWKTGETGDGSFLILVSYADDEQHIYKNWPEAIGLDVLEETDSYMFTGRFASPEWLTDKDTLLLVEENKMDGEKAKSKDGQVTYQLLKQSKLLETAYEAINILEALLIGALRDGAPTAEDSQSQSELEALVPIADKLALHNRKLENGVAMLEDIAERIEL
jgi:hypothetical protein